METYKTARIKVVENAGGTTLELKATSVEDGHQVVVDNASGVTFDVANEGGASLATLLNGVEHTFIYANDAYILMARR